VRPDNGGVGVRHLDATEALGIAVGASNETVQRVTPVEVRHPRDARVVIWLTVGEFSRHGRRRIAQVDGKGAVSGGSDADTCIDGSREKRVIVDVERERFGLSLGDGDVRVGIGIDGFRTRGRHDGVPRRRVHLSGRGQVVHVLETHERSLEDDIVGVDAP
jgi:hypothetical protein